MTDGQGTTKLVTSSSQTITSTQETEAFGRTIATTGSTSNPFGYHGAEGYRQDGDGPAGLEPYQKVGARYYDATFGRFITRDTDLGQSPYVYCDGDPVNNSDPTGHLSAVNIASGGIAIAGEIDGAAEAPVDTSGDNTSSSSTSSSSGGSNTGYGAIGGDKPSGVTGGVTTSGLNTTVSLTSPTGVGLTAQASNGHPTSVGASGSISLSGLLSGLSFTFSDLVKFGGVNNQTAGLSYQSGIFKVSLVGSSSGGVTAMAGISTH